MLRVRCELTGAPIAGGGLSTFYFTQSDAAGAAAAVSAVVIFWNSVTGVVNSAITIRTQPDVAVIDPPTGNVTLIHPIASTTIVGGDGGEVLPYETQGLIRLRTGVVSDGKEIRGRLFVPGPCEARNAAGLPIAAYVTALETAATALMAAAGSDWAVYRRRREARPAIPPNPVLPRGLPALAQRDGEVAAVTTAVGWTKWAGLRSRRD